MAAERREREGNKARNCFEEHAELKPEKQRIKKRNKGKPSVLKFCLSFEEWALLSLL